MSQSTIVYDPVSEFCSLYHHATAVIGDKLYILQGFLVYFVNNEREKGSNPRLRVLDINTTSNVSTIADHVVLADQEQYPETLPQTLNPILWYNERTETMILAMGWTSPRKGGVLIQPDLWNPGLIGQMWTSQRSPGGDAGEFTTWVSGDLNMENQMGLISSRTSYFDNESQMGYIVGGVVNSTPTDSFIIYDATANIWTNSTLPWGRTYGNGAMGSLRLNDRLVHIFVGGTVDGVTVQMDVARIYDSQTQKWYSQTIRGARPGPRADPCFAMVSAQDGSSHQLIINGGTSDGDNAPFNSDTWVLNIPSFTWVRLEDSRSLSSPGQRSGQSCKIVHGHILAVYGGKHAALANNQAICDTNGNAAFFLDLNTVQWMDVYEGVQEDYAVPSMVIDVIGGTSTGGATLLAPSGGFEDEVLADIFAINGTPILNSNRSPTLRPAPTSGNPNIGAPPTPFPVGAAVGGAIGGVALLVFSILIWLCLVRRKRRSGTFLEGDFKGIVQDEIPVGGRTELPVLPEGMTYQQYLAAYKDSRNNSSFNTPRLEQMYFYELPAGMVPSSPTETEGDPLSPFAGQQQLDSLELPSVPMPPGPPSSSV